jgi:putative glutamine amidotransferase
MKPVIGITTAIKKEPFRSYSQVGYEYIDKI